MANFLAYGEDVIGSDVESSGGHTIENPSGTTMTQRANLQFAGNNVTVTDDSTNDRTVVTISGGSGSGITILSYGTSTWNDFTTAYSNNNVVFCKASITDSDPSSGTQSRHAVLSYVDNPANPTRAEFLYPKTTNSHDYNHQTDTMIVYTLDSTNGWSCTTRYTSTNIVPRDGIAYTYNSTKGGTIYLSTPSITGSFSDATNYTVGDYVYYNNNLYKCTTAHTGAWDASHFTQTTVGEELENAGHLIYDSTGTLMTQRRKLEFDGYLQTTDDSADGATVVSDAPIRVTKAQWDAMSAQDKQGKKWLITNVPGAEGEVEIETMHLAWSNPNPTSDFASQQITLNADADYDFVRFIAALNNAMNISVDIPKGNGGVFSCAGTSNSTYSNNYFRSISYVSDTQFIIGDGVTQKSNAARTVTNNVLIPIEIYTYKKTLTAKISAIAANVSTRADHCMLSDNVSSVENALNYSTSEHVVGKWIDGSTLYEKTIDFGALPNATTKSKGHGITNLGKVISINGIATKSGAFKPIPYIWNATHIDIEATDSLVYINTGSDMSSYTATYVTLRYTKTS